ncbi:MAG: hypothetical protein J3K34DRAFT_435782 [Monoraphidium minutum]|nr:MAG: hypothetical protein J3K34DRAFT_435782 [Monoraphidium minutum]
MQPRLLLLAAVVASLATGIAADLVQQPQEPCSATQYPHCREHRMLPGTIMSNNYCLVSMAQDCKYVDSAGNKNIDCNNCWLWNTAQTNCSSTTPASTCAKKFFVQADNCAQNVWKIWPSKTAWTGIEDMADGKQAGQMNYLWSNLWLSGVQGTNNPCANKGYKTLHLEKAPYGTMLINAFAYRTQHTWHAHMGPAHPDLRGAVAELLKGMTKAKKWTDTPTPYTWNTATHGHVDSRLWGYLWGPVNAKKYSTQAPPNVGTLIGAAHKGQGPLASMSADERMFTGAAVTGAEFNGKHYFMVVLYNYYQAWNINKSKQIGEYELILHA